MLRISPCNLAPNHCCCTMTRCNTLEISLYRRWRREAHSSARLVQTSPPSLDSDCGSPPGVRPSFACDRESHVGQWDVIRDGAARPALCVIEWHSDTLLEWHLDSDVNCLRSKSVVEAKALLLVLPRKPDGESPSPPKRANSLLIELARHGSPIPWQSELINRRTR